MFAPRAALVLALAPSFAVVPTGVASADPPPAPTPAARTAPAAPAARNTSRRGPEIALPETCGQDPFHVDYGPIGRGALVRLGRHRAVDGQANWDPSMEHYVGRVTPIVSARGVDPQGCAIVEVAADGGEYVWRVRDLVMVASARDANATEPPEIRMVPGGAADPRVYEGAFPSTTRRADTLERACPGWVAERPTLTLLLEDEVPTLSLLVHSSVDAVLVVKTPDGRIVCVDDADARDPVLTGHAAAGRYEVYIGTFEPLRGRPTFRLGLSERGSVRASVLAEVNARDVLPLVATPSGPTRTRLQVGRPAPSAPAASGGAESGAPSAPAPAPGAEPSRSSNTR